MHAFSINVINNNYNNLYFGYVLYSYFFIKLNVWKILFSVCMKFSLGF